MRERTRRLAIVIGGTVLTGAALILAACSSDTFTPIPLAGTGETDAGAGRDAKTDAKGKTDGAQDEFDSGGADCSAAPRLRSNDEAFFCPFLPKDGGPDASSTTCAHDETCCNPGKAVSGASPPSFCATTPRADKGLTDQSACAAQAAGKGTEWVATGGLQWECGDSNNCASGKVCCMFTSAAVAAPDKVNIGPNLNKALPTACNAKQAFKHGGTYCASTCGPEDLLMCSTTDESCGAKKCIPFEVFPGGRNLGYCN